MMRFCQIPRNMGFRYGALFFPVPTATEMPLKALRKVLVKSTGAADNGLENFNTCVNAHRVTCDYGLQLMRFVNARRWPDTRLEDS